MRWTRQKLAKYADAALLKENTRLQARCDAQESSLKIAQLELDKLIAVVTRDLERVKSETATFTRKIADAEGSPNVSTY